MWQPDPHARSRPLSSGIVLALTILASVCTQAPAAPAAAELTTSLAPAELTLGAVLAVTGRLRSGGQGLPGVPLELQGDPYPFRRFAPLARVASSADGSFSFPGIRPDRDMRLRVVSEGSTAVSGPTLAVTVDPKLSSSARSLGPGRVRLTLRVRHAITGIARSVGARWFLAARASRVYRLAAVTATRELAPGVTYASAIVDPPVRRFVYRVCMNPPWEKAMGPAATHRRCPEASFVVGGHGR
jgi:hypothetical protein